MTLCRGDYVSGSNVTCMGILYARPSSPTEPSTWLIRLLMRIRDIYPTKKSMWSLLEYVFMTRSFGPLLKQHQKHQHQQKQKHQHQHQQKQKWYNRLSAAQRISEENLQGQGPWARRRALPSYSRAFPCNGRVVELDCCLGRITKYQCLLL